MNASPPVALYLARNLVVGGAERVFLNFVNHAEAVRPVVALLERRGGLLGDLRGDVPCFSRMNPAVKPGLAEDGAFPGASFARMALECRWLRSVAARTEARVVSSFLMRAHIVALLTKLTLMPRMRVVLNIHEHMSESAEFFYPHARDRSIMRWVARHLFPRADRIVVVAEALKLDLVRTYGVPDALIDVVYNPLDIARIRAGAVEAAVTAPVPPTRRTIVAAGRLVHLKGYDLLLRAIAQLRVEHDVSLVLIGDGDARESLERLAAELGLASAVTFVGEQANPWRFITGADALALTSRTEAFPCVLTEAMALGVPVLATNCSAGVSECLRGGACGVLVPSEDVGAIALGLDRLLRDLGLRASLASAGLERAAGFDLPAVRDRYESVLTGAIESRGV